MLKEQSSKFFCKTDQRLENFKMIYINFFLQILSNLKMQYRVVCSYIENAKKIKRDVFHANIIREIFLT